MLRRYFVIASLGLALFACKSQETVSDTPQTQPAQSSTPVVETKVDSAPLNFDAAGSDSGKIDGLQTVNFEYDKSSLSAASKKKIQGNATWMKNNPKVKVQIEGHCDSRGSIEYNVALGERRANAVKNHMVSLGVSGDRLSVISYGKEKPIDSSDNEAAWSKNRRANFVPAAQ